MPTPSQRAIALRKIEHRINRLSHLITCSPARRLYLFYVSLYDSISSRRYLDHRPLFPSYQKHRYILQANLRFPGIDSHHKQLLRVTHTEFDRLLRIFGDDVMFQAKGRKPMAPAKLQLAVLLHRMAHGHSIPQIAALFNLPGKFSFLGSVLINLQLGACLTTQTERCAL